MTNEELLNGIATIWKQKKSGQLSEELAFEDYRNICENFDASFGEGSARAVLTNALRVEPAEFTWCTAAISGLGPDSGNLQQRLNDSDAVFMKMMGITL